MSVDLGGGRVIKEGKGATGSVVAMVDRYRGWWRSFAVRVLMPGSTVITAAASSEPVGGQLTAPFGPVPAARCTCGGGARRRCGAGQCGVLARHVGSVSVGLRAACRGGDGARITGSSDPRLRPGRPTARSYTRAPGYR